MTLSLPLLLLSALLAHTGASVCFGGGSNPMSPQPIPAAKALALTPYSEKCATTPDSVFGSGVYADGSGPRTADNVTHCCSLCAADSTCKFFTFNVDSAIKGTQCRWATLTHCCTFLSSAGALQQHPPPTKAQPSSYGAKGVWSSGSMHPLAAVSASSSSGGVGATAAAGPQKTELVLTNSTAIVVADASLLSVARTLSDELYMASGVRLLVKKAGNATGDVRLSIDKSLQPEEYSLVVSGRGVMIAGGSKAGVAWGTVTVTQTLCISGVPAVQIALPAMTIKDSPDFPYRGLLLDTARSLVRVEELKDAVQLCRFYKIRYLHLHLTDDHAWTFPSSSYPKLGDDNIGFRGMTPNVYTKAQVRAQLVHGRLLEH